MVRAKDAVVAEALDLMSSFSKHMRARSTMTDYFVGRANTMVAPVGSCVSTSFRPPGETQTFCRRFSICRYKVASACHRARVMNNHLLAAATHVACAVLSNEVACGRQDLKDV